MMTPPPFAAMPSEAGLLLPASIVVGLAVWVLAWWVFRALRSEDPEQGAEWRFM